MSAVELNHGDQLRFRLRNGRTVSLVLEATRAAIVEEVVPGGIVYRFSADVRIDGHPMTLERFVCSQECFYEPYVVNGVRIWLDIVRDVFDLIPVRYPQKGNRRRRPRKAGTSFAVRVRHAAGENLVRVQPEMTRTIGTFDFAEGTSGFVEIVAADSRGLVLVLSASGARNRNRTSRPAARERARRGSSFARAGVACSADGAVLPRKVPGVAPFFARQGIFHRTAASR